MTARDEWYSAAALEKQAEVKRLMDAGEQPPLSLMVGIREPRTQPAEHERCVNCGLDARDETGGRESKGFRWCDLCLGRGRDEDYLP